MSKPGVPVMEEAASRLERDHVHNVYEKIAPYFNDSRYKAWPKVRQFLLDQEYASIVADVGCGNGKYLHINNNVFKLGCDVCRPLVDAAWSQGHEVQMCDGLRLPYRDGCFDAVLSIAVIHHLSTKERRIRAIKEMARTLRIGGRIMIYVWAMEQKRRKFEKQDIFVPWNPNPPSSPGFGREHAKVRKRGTAQSVSEAIDSTDKHRKVKSTSSMLEEEDMTVSTQQRTQRLWIFSRSLDSVFDFGSLTISQSSSRDLSTLPSPISENDQNKASHSGRRRGLIKKVSSFFSSSRQSSEEDVFDSVVDLPKGQQDYGGNISTTTTTTTDQSVSAAYVQECVSVALPDLVSYQKGPEAGEEKEKDVAPQGKDQQQQGEIISPQASYEQGTGSCLRYYHVFREGELAELIRSHIEELHVTQTYFDHANWCVVAEKVQVWKI